MSSLGSGGWLPEEVVTFDHRNEGKPCGTIRSGLTGAPFVFTSNDQDHATGSLTYHFQTPASRRLACTP